MELRETAERKRNLSYDQSLKNPLYLQMNVAVNAARQYFESLPKKGLEIYDFGCGSKPYQVFAGENEYIGIDIDKKNKMADIFSSIDDVSVENCVADVVCSFYALEHVYDPKLVLKEKYRLLRSGGELFMLVPLYWEEHEQPYDFWRFTRFSLRNMLEEVGFSDIKINPINANWSILGINLARVFNSRGYMRLFVPLINWVFYKLDQRGLKNSKVPSNVMSYSVRAIKGMQ